MIASFVLAAAQTMTFTADRIAADNATRALTASGRVEAVSSPYSVRGELMTRDAEGVMHFHDPTCATTCTNAVGHTHWNVTGELVYKERDYVILRNAWARLFEVPVLWLPYFYYPLDVHCGFRWIAGYTGHWGAYVLTRYSYQLLGGPLRDETTSWLDAATRVDLRHRMGIGLGEDFEWNLGEFGAGSLELYYHNPMGFGKDANYGWWMGGTGIRDDRYSAVLDHVWEATERDRVRVRGTALSDAYFVSDFARRTTMGWRNSLYGRFNTYSYDTSGVFWEHLENNFTVGAEVSGRTGDFYEAVGRLPEVFFDLNPMPLWGLPVNYETGSRLGWLRRNPAELGYGDAWRIYSTNPGAWAEYSAARFDTYHRLTAPFTLFGDVVSAVPRVGYHGTFWSQSGAADLTGRRDATKEGELGRSILEGGMTLSARGEGRVDGQWRHQLQPYLDLLAQRAWFGGAGDRPYLFDSIDGSVAWEDQFAGRSRNLPYTYYGATPGLRNVWERQQDNGNFRQIVDFDAYAAFQFGATEYLGASERSRLAERGRSNYGEHQTYAAPGARVKWTPGDDISLLARAEYDPDENAVAVADLGWRQRVDRDLSYGVMYALRDYRCWDFAPSQAEAFDGLDDARLHLLQLTAEQQICDWLAWGPFVMWDIRDGGLDSAGAWIDYLTDCLGFRFLVEYETDYRRPDGYWRDADWSFGFYIYLRALGSADDNKFF